MIDPDRVDAFLAEKTRRHAWLKSKSEAEIDALLNEHVLPEKLGVPKRPLLKQQKVALLLGCRYNRFEFWLDMGAGKSRVAIELLRYRLAQDKRAIVLCASETAVHTWENQCKEWNLGIPFVNLGSGSSKERWQALDAAPRHCVILLAYPALVALCSYKVKVAGRKSAKMKADVSAVSRLVKDVSMVVFDESTKVANHRSLVFDVCENLVRTVKYRYALSGWPFGRDPHALWSQCYLIDDGETLGSTLGLFRAAFFEERPSRWKFVDYVLRPEMKEVLAKRLEHRSVSYSVNECVALPEPFKSVELISLPQSSKKYLLALYEQANKAKLDGNLVTSLFIRMRQISSGFLGHADVDSGERAVIELPHNPKLEHLLELVNDTQSRGKFVVFYDYNWSGAKIVSSLGKFGIKTHQLWSGTSDTKRVLKEFDDRADVRGLVINNRVGSMSLNLQVANYVFFYESPVSVLDRKQAERRCHRQGQTKPVYMYDLVVEGTADQRILDFHKEGADLMAELVRNPGKLLSMFGGRA